MFPEFIFTQDDADYPQAAINPFVFLTQFWIQEFECHN